jgi:hypothetical protein
MASWHTRSTKDSSGRVATSPRQERSAEFPEGTATGRRLKQPAPDILLVIDVAAECLGEVMLNIHAAVAEIRLLVAEEPDWLLNRVGILHPNSLLLLADEIYMGTDASIVQAARVSYGKGTKKVHEDRGLIRYLMRHRHTTPFEMCELKLHVRVPMDCWRQWIRHRTANVNEYSSAFPKPLMRHRGQTSRNGGCRHPPTSRVARATSTRPQGGG